ncbi:MAG: hypothetical protein ACFCU5_03770 [Pleurocapsa sp.]
MKQLTAQLVLKEAENWGFPCQINRENRWEILPIKPEKTWKLIEAESQWILSVKNIPQLRLNSQEAIAFLAEQTNKLDS